MHMSNSTNYKYAGARSVNGQMFGIHQWNCTSCPWNMEVVGGRKELNAGARKASKHECYDSSKDSWSDRKDLQ